MELKPEEMEGMFSKDSWAVVLPLFSTEKIQAVFVSGDDMVDFYEGCETYLVMWLIFPK